MLSTVEFDDELRFDASKVGNESSDGELTTELEAAQAALAQVEPEAALGIGG